MEDLRGILYNLNATADAFARHAIDFRQVSAINRLMQTCLETIQKMKQLEEEVSPEEIVRAAHFDVRGNGLAESEAEPDPQPESSATASSVLEFISAVADPHAEPMRFQPPAPKLQLNPLLPTHTKSPHTNKRIFKHLQNRQFSPAAHTEQHLLQAGDLRRQFFQGVVQAAFENQKLDFILRMRAGREWHLRIDMLASQLRVRPDVTRVA